MTTATTQNPGGNAPATPAPGVQRIVVLQNDRKPLVPHLFGLLFSFEHLLLFYLVSGSTKDYINAFGLPFPGDISLLSGAMVIAALGYTLLRDKRLPFNGDAASRTICIVFLCLVSLEMVSLLWTSSVDWATAKSYRILVIVPAFFAATLWPGFRPKLFLQFLTLYGIPLAAGYVYLQAMLWQNWEVGSPAHEIRGYYLGFGVIVGAVFVANVTSATFKPFLRTGFALTAIILCVLTTARGASMFSILAVVFGVGWHFFTRARTHISPMAMLPFGAAMLIVIFGVITFSGLFEDILNQMLSRLKYLASESDPIRMKFYQDAFLRISEKPWMGWGLGSFGVVTTGIDKPHHPHNFLLEMWFESGVIGGLLAAAFLSMLFIKLALGGNMIHRALFLFLVANMMKSGAIDDHRFILGMLSVVMVIAVRREDSMAPSPIPGAMPMNIGRLPGGAGRPGRNQDGLWLPQNADLGAGRSRG